MRLCTVLGALCAGLVLTGCSGDNKPTTSSTNRVALPVGRGAPGGAQNPPGPADGGGTGIEVGKTAPEIEGEDLDGKRFKLSDYRGKVVLLDFWGNW